LGEKKRLPFGSIYVLHLCPTYCYTAAPTSGSAVCYTAVPGEKPLYDDEPRSAKEVDAHPEREAILKSAEAEINQFI
jgi:hypothetical protein